MERKKVSFWIWLGLVFVLACLLTCLVTVFANGPADQRELLEPKLRQQTLNLASVAVYLALIFLGHPLAYAALGLGALFGQLFLGRPWFRCLLTAGVTEGVLVVFCLLYDWIILGVGFGQAMRMFGLHLLSGLLCFGLGVVLLKLFYEHWNGGRDQTMAPTWDAKPRRVLQ